MNDRKDSHVVDASTQILFDAIENVEHLPSSVISKHMEAESQQTKALTSGKEIYKAFSCDLCSQTFFPRMKEVLKEQEIVNWNTAFVDISPKLISVIKAYRETTER